MEGRTKQCLETGGLASHDVTMSKASVANAKVGQGNLLIMVPVARRLTWTNGQSQLTQLTVVCNTLTPAGLPSGADGPLKRTEVVPKREDKVDLWGLACSPFGHHLSPFINREAYIYINIG